MQIQENGIQKVLYKALDDVSLEKQYQEKCLLMLVHALQSYKDSISEERHNSDAERIHLFSKYQLIVSSVLMTTLPRHFPGSCFWIFTLYKHVLDLNWLSICFWKLSHILIVVVRHAILIVCMLCTIDNQS